MNSFSLAPSQNTVSSGTSSGTSAQTGTTTGASSGLTTSAGQTAGSQANTYTPGQAALQQQLGGAYSGYLGGNVPTGFTQNPQLVGAYNTAFNQNIAPGLAAQGGAGSPQMQSNYAMGLQSLLANQYNTGVSEYGNALSGASGFGLTATGQNTTGSNSGTTATTGNTAGTSTGASGQTGATQGTSTVTQPLNLLDLLGW